MVNPGKKSQRKKVICEVAMLTRPELETEAGAPNGNSKPTTQPNVKLEIDEDRCAIMLRF
jgi:hypothetical protein